MAARDRHGKDAPWGEFAVVGKPLRKVDGLAKATGAAIYADDIALPGMLHAKTLRSPHAHARIVSIDASDALALPGVHAVITGKDLPVKYGVIPWTPDENALAVDKVRFIGDPVAAVAAVDEDTANAALKRIRVEYELLHAYLDPRESLTRHDPAIHEGRKEGNVSKNVLLEFGAIDQALATSDVIVEDEYTFHGTTHAAIEPHCAVAQYSADGVLTVWSATQITHYVHRALARVLELAPHRIRVVQPCLGGAFGGKSDPFSLEFCVATLAMRTGRPVKMLYTREEVFYCHRGRHPMQMRYRTGASKDGMLRGVDAKILIDGGSYSSFGLVTTYYAGQLLTGPYAFPTYRFDSTRVFTNKPPCGPKRGHGSVQPRFAFEVQLDQLAEKLALDPIEIRRRNFVGEHTTTVNGQRITSNGFLACLDQVERASDWSTRHGKLPFGRGLGVAGSMYISGTNYPVYPNKMPQAGIQLKVDRSGLVLAFTGGNDIGQGSNSVVQYIVAEELGLALDQVRVVAADTDLCPVDLGAYSSRVTFMVGNATIDACRKLRAQLVEALAAHWQVDAKRVRLIHGEALDLEDATHHLPIVEAFHLAEERFDTLGATGSYNTPELGGPYRGGTIGASPAYSFTAHVAEVTVDIETGRVRCEKVWIAHDCGRALNPMLVAGQMEGSAYMGVAEALMEEHTVNRYGLHRGPSLLDYRIPTSVDTPELAALIVESLDPEGPYGAKEAGEGPLHPSIPAISNAIFDAVGIRLKHLPFTPGKVLAALAERRARAGEPTVAGGAR
ncbi:MAG: molybdopterin-dependent oxidoreductase [Planctomycetes bacterium]|nr:molybdopterin-dependent oxidoreductase [Planctomycetota bacterium]